MAHNGTWGIYYVWLCRVTRGTKTEHWTCGIYYIGLFVAQNGALGMWYILCRVTRATQRSTGQVVYTI